ncbi:uncharacterized protein LOC128548182 [Mercenaria mercenaria]|uniref:uncharacterized protein LOC128548182 n=1 Tax=Mercenaria mercenaria TaxID=6596 RepID=UPI00234E8B05|nr:uncharacterized protein LOC128548182 [Mercenaria mercenaria]
MTEKLQFKSRKSDHHTEEEEIYQLCKYGQQDRREYYYTLGFHSDAVFIAERNDNETTILLSYNGFRSMNGKMTYVRLVCDRERILPQDANFTILKDMKGLGKVYGELHHVSCCPDGYLQVQNTDQDGQPVKQTHTEGQLTINGTDNLSNSTDSGEKSVL